MTSDEIRKRHFKRLNSYRHSMEYAEYARKNGDGVARGGLPRLIGDRWEIDEAIYNEFLGMFPPLGWRHNGFFLSEFSFGDVTTRYTKDGDRFFCEFARYPERNKPVQTPWGPAISSHTYAPGITFHETETHGGFHLSPERIAELPRPFRDFQTFAGGAWFEEDCDWCIVALSFPQFFAPGDTAKALATLKGDRPHLYREVADLFANSDRGRAR